MAFTTTFLTRAGGVMTREVGTVTGEVELETSLTDGRAHHRIRYCGAREWYQLADEEPVRVDGEEAARRSHDGLVDSLRATTGEPSTPTDPPHGSQQGRNAEDPAAGSFGGARSS